jgi:hypothetical protein
MQLSPVGLPWYKPENFRRLRAMCPDGNVLQDTYDDWLASAQKYQERLVAQGKRVIRADIDPASFQIWCDIRGMRMDSTARRVYAGMIAQQVFCCDMNDDALQ